ncbi:MAG: GNAT family N-acetyltransferase [Lachnospiraceae bacterium]|nr:GNAT family N-acetyltransferase [Lachnospiraceae bacterium]
MEFRVFEMQYAGIDVEPSGIMCVPFDAGRFKEYKEIYNDCFYEMRKDLDRKPYNYLESMEQLGEKAEEIMLLIENDEIVGSVACYGNEVDDLIVNQKFQRQGYGRKLLLYGMERIRSRNQAPITLHVTEWNQYAAKMYQNVGFEITKTITIKD